MPQTRRIEINSEEDAWRTLEEAAAAKGDWDHVEFAFQGWPRLRVDLEGENFHASLTPSVMQAFLETQKTIFRTYARLEYGSSDTRRLSEDERKALELVVEVKPGTSDLIAYAEKLAVFMANHAVDKMDGVELTITICTLLVGIFGVTALKAWLNQKAKETEADLRVRLSDRETERANLMKELAENRPVLSVVADESDELKEETLRHFRSADRVEFGDQRDVTLNRAQVYQLVKPRRERSERSRIDGVFRVHWVDSSRAENLLKIRVFRAADGMEFGADVGSLSMREEQLLRDAVFERKPVFIAFDAKILRGEVTSARVMRVDPPAETTQDQGA